MGVFLFDEPQNTYNYRELYFTVENYTFLTTEKIPQFNLFEKNVVPDRKVQNPMKHSVFNNKINVK